MFRSIALLLTFVLCLGASGNVAATTNVQSLHWIVSQTSLARLRSQMSMDELRQLFDSPNTYIIVNSKNKDDGMTHAKHVIFYRDEEKLEQDLNNGTLRNVDGVLYDDEQYVEPGNTTPDEQKENPLPFVKRASEQLHAQGKILVYTIGANTGPKGQFFTTTLPSVSPYPDVIDFQTQAAEGTPRFAQQVDRYSRVYHANGGKVMLVGLAVAPKGENKSAADIMQAYNDALSHNPPVDGFWLNMAVKSASCTGCAERADVTPGVQFLRAILAGRTSI